FVSKVESGERGLKLGEVYSYAEALGIDVFKLVEAVRGQANH
ncbi:MAG: XRE family transcriptional regulator, partial [Megasphaera micronuciformis]|nr:XRE family transcriptional regulator [Megasphaera micronuciformis]